MMKEESMNEMSAAPGSSVPGDTIICPLTGEEISPCCCPLNMRKSMLKKMLAAFGLTVMIGIGAIYAAGFHRDARATVAVPVTSAPTETIICPLTGEEISPCCCPLNKDAATPTVAAAPAVTPITNAPTDTITCPLTGEEISPCCCPLNKDKEGS